MGRRMGWVLAACLVLIPIGVRAAEVQKLGFIDAQKILDQTRVGKKAKERMEEFVKSRQKIIDVDESEIKRQQDDLARQGTVLSEEARRAKEEQLQKRFAEYQKRVADLNKEVQSKKKEILEEFNKSLEEIVKHVAEKSGYTFVLDRGAEGGALFYAKETYDLTAEVVKEFDKVVPKE